MTSTPLLVNREILIFKLYRQNRKGGIMKNKKETIKNLFILDDNAKHPMPKVLSLLEDFRKNIPTLESKQKIPLVLFQDGKNGGYYIECHIEGKVAVPLMDYDAVLDPDQQEEFRANRALKPWHVAFIIMQSDAKKGRQFSDIITEYDKSYQSDQPLKVFGGQHRGKSIEEANNKGISRYHGFRIFFGLTMEQRGEIIQISNTNIQISPDLLDRVSETQIRSGLRQWCQEIGLLKKKKDFADSKNVEGVVSVKLARTFVVNFFNGKEFKGSTDESVFNPYVCNSGTIVDENYYKLLKLNGKNIWKDKSLFEAGKNFSFLHKKQMEMIDGNPELKNIKEFRIKALSAAVVSSWALVAGLIQKDSKRLARHYAMPKIKKDRDPLNAKEMSISKHHTDDPTYRGLGARSTKKDKGRLVQLFLLNSKKESKKGLSKEMIEAAIKGYEAILAIEEKEKAESKIK